VRHAQTQLHTQQPCDGHVVPVHVIPALLSTPKKENVSPDGSVRLSPSCTHNSTEQQYSMVNSVQNSAVQYGHFSLVQNNTVGS